MSIPRLLEALRFFFVISMTWNVLNMILVSESPGNLNYRSRKMPEFAGRRRRSDVDADVKISVKSCCDSLLQ